MVIAIREAVAADAPQVQALYEVLTQKPCSVLPSRIAEIGANDANFLFVAERDGQVVGTVFVTLCLDVM
ncbi:MAG: hypothetical protein DMF90_24715 [Acidobacteria bacterium]|nr:MAG: hypothetical protein DMF90_24715 [Acidobacteriota bacterium]